MVWLDFRRSSSSVSQRVSRGVRMEVGARPTRATNAGPAMLTAALETYEPHQPIASQCAAFLDASPDAFHATANACARFLEAGFTCLDEREALSGKVKPGGKYFYTRNRSSVVAFAVGCKYAA